MEYIIGIIVALVGGIFYFKGKADKAEAGSRIAHTKGRDQELEERQAEVEKAIADLDKGIADLKAKKEAVEKKNKYRSLKERAEEAKNRYKK